MLQNGFLSRKRELKLPRGRLTVGILVWLPYVVLLYLFATGFREIVRFAMFEAPNSTAGFFSDFEAFYYNFFFAFWFCIIGFSQTIEFMATSVSAPRLERYLVLNDARALVAFFTYFLPKILLMFTIFCMAMPVLEYTNFIQEYWYFYPLLTVVLFMSQWTRIIRRFRNSMKWMFVTLGVFVITSSVLAFFPLISHRTTQNVVLKYRPDLQLVIDLPEAVSRTRATRMSLVFRLYYGANKDRTTDTLLVFENKTMGREEIASIIASQRDRLPSNEGELLTMHLHADQNLPMKVVRALLKECRAAGLSRIRFITSPVYENAGVDACLNDSLTSRDIAFRREHETIVKLRKGIISVGDKRLSDTELKNAFERQIADTIALVLDIDTESTYGSYVALYDIIAQAEKAVVERSLGKDEVELWEYWSFRRKRFVRVVELQ